MLDWISLFGFSTNTLKDTFLLYKRITEQYTNSAIINKVRSLIPQDVVLKTTTKEQYVDVIPLLKWFKKEFMEWTPAEPICENCINNSRRTISYIFDNTNSSSGSHRSSTKTASAAAADKITETPKMQLKEIIEGNSWQMRKVEI